MSEVKVGDTVGFNELYRLPFGTKFESTGEGYRVIEIPEPSEREKLIAKLRDLGCDSDTAVNVAEFITEEYWLKKDPLAVVTDCDGDRWIRNSEGTYGVTEQTLEYIKNSYGPVVDNEGNDI